MRDVALQMNKLYELYIKGHLQTFWAKHTKNLALQG
jgi:hypothetical protein